MSFGFATLSIFQNNFQVNFEVGVSRASATAPSNVTGDLVFPWGHVIFKHPQNKHHIRRLI
jgi:hypothetical protein